MDGWINGDWLPDELDGPYASHNRQPWIEKVTV